MNMPQPPDVLKERVLHSLRDKGLVRRPPRFSVRAVLFVIALLAALGAGYSAGRMRDLPAPEGQRFALLLYEDSTFRARHEPGSGVAEYTAWAHALAARGALEVGEKLGATSRAVGTTASGVQGDGAPTGLFIIRAADLAAATEVAKTCPHVRYGGTVVVHSIE
jgi:hypothetical protein